MHMSFPKSHATLILKLTVSAGSLWELVRCAVLMNGTTVILLKPKRDANFQHMSTQLEIRSSSGPEYSSSLTLQLWEIFLLFVNNPAHACCQSNVNELKQHTHTELCAVLISEQWLEGGPFFLPQAVCSTVYRHPQSSGAGK